MCKLFSRHGMISAMPLVGCFSSTAGLGRSCPSTAARGGGVFENLAGLVRAERSLDGRNDRQHLPSVLEISNFGPRSKPYPFLAAAHPSDDPETGALRLTSCHLLTTWWLMYVRVSYGPTLASDMLEGADNQCAKWVGVVSWCGEKKDYTTPARGRSQLPDVKWSRLLLSVLLVLVKEEWRSDLYGSRRIVASSHRHIHTPPPPLLCSCWFRAAPNQISMFAWALFWGRCRPHSFWRHLGPEVGFLLGATGMGSPATTGPSGNHGMQLRIDGSRHCRPAGRPLVTPVSNSVTAILPLRIRPNIESCAAPHSNVAATAHTVL